MQFTEMLDIPGEHSLLLQGGVGHLETILTIPQQINSQYVAFLGHPHSLQGGTMNNKVVTTLARVFKELGIPSLRFNFRGVGLSEGIYDDGIGESDDMISLAKLWNMEQPQTQFIFAGFSFGSYVAYRTAALFGQGLLITIAPPVHHYNYSEFSPLPQSWLILQGEDDEVVPSEEVYRFAKASSPEISVVRFAQTGHFFHGKLLDLKAALMDYLRQKVQLS